MRYDDRRPEIWCGANEKWPKMNGLAGVLHEAAAAPANDAETCALRAGRRLRGRQLRASARVEQGLVKRPEGRQVLCRASGNDAGGQVEKAPAPQERRQGFVPAEAAVR